MGSNMYCFNQKCKMLKQKAKEWSQNKFDGVSGQLSKRDTQINLLQPLIINNSASTTILSKYSRLLRKGHKLLSFSTTYLQQRSKIKYLKTGDQIIHSSTEQPQFGKIEIC